MRVPLKRVPWLVLLTLTIVFTGWRAMTGYADLDAGAEEELAFWLRAEYAREALRELTGEDPLGPAQVDSLLAVQRVTFESVKARGTLDDMIVRAEVLVNGRPASEDAVRYFRMSYSTITGWHMKRESHAIAYYATIF